MYFPRKAAERQLCEADIESDAIKTMCINSTKTWDPVRGRGRSRPRRRTGCSLLSGRRGMLCNKSALVTT